MKPTEFKPDWKWGTPEGSREFDRILGRSMTFREKLQWLQESETLALRMQASLKRRMVVADRVTGGGDE